jgi:hypothetical protein
MICKYCGGEIGPSDGMADDGTGPEHIPSYSCLKPLKEERDRLLLQNEKMKKLLRGIVEPIFKADEAKDKDAHIFCNCLCCQAWAIYENDKTEKREGH